MDLGGNDAFIALRDCNVTKAVKGVYTSRMNVNGQAPENAKRIFV